MILGDLSCDASAGSVYVGECFVPAGGAGGGEYDMRTVADAVVYSVSTGIVFDIITNPPPQDDDFELGILPVENSAYIIFYDHIVDLKVSKGDKVEPGTILGKASLEHGRGRIELSAGLRNGNDGSCPADFGTPEFNAAFDKALAAHNSEFTANTYSGVCNFE